MKSISRPNSLTFILGCQRSGTTWLANIFDSSPDTLLFMEPFAPAYNIFPEFPDTTFFLDGSSPYLYNLMEREMPSRLISNKYLLFENSMWNPILFRIERFIAKKSRSLGFHKLFSRLQKFELLNLNRMDDSFPLIKKNPAPSIWIIKELRFAGKISILLDAYPSAHVVTIIRHPSATVQSILKWMEKGHLGELKRDLDLFLEKIEVQSISEPYKQLISDCKSGDLIKKIAFYWRICYETMYRKLEEHPLTYHIVYEELATKPEETTRQLFMELSLPWSNSVEQYIKYSPGRNDLSEKIGPLNTVRNSPSYFQSWKKTIPESVERSVFSIVNDSVLMNIFNMYYS